MRLLLLISLCSLSVAQDSVELLANDVQIATRILAHEAQQECESLPFKAFFDVETLTCFVAQNSSRTCDTIRFTYGSPSAERTEVETKLLESEGIKEDNNTHICVFRVAQIADTLASAEEEVLSTTTSTTTTATTTPATTTQAPKIKNPKSWIIKKGTEIYRRRQPFLLQHTYTMNSTEISRGWEVEAGPGFVVSEDDYASIKTICPHLIRVGMWRNLNMVTYIGNQPDEDMKQIGSFYCAPRQFYCGANFQLRSLDKHDGFSRLYPSTDVEALQQLIGEAPGVYRNYRYGNWPCWIWQNHTETWYSIVRAAGHMIHRGYNVEQLTHFYSLPLYKIPYGNGWNWEVGPGFVVTEPQYQTYFKKQCPELIQMSIWHGVNKKGEIVSYIGRSPPVGFKFIDEKNQQFYCAPRFNYCNANFELKRIDKDDASSFFYPSSPSETQLQLGESPPQEAFVKYVETPCFIWRNWIY